ncbi:MAG: peptide-methionine (R)-S-oxide reductase MsrB [Bacteroidetes bacterium]|nr:peptide-methionine (R)-S-oxide reductase MsrB [Bacteroidota bacterium]
MKNLMILLATGILLQSCQAQTKSTTNPEETKSNMSTTHNNPQGMSEEEWKKILTPEQYRILREKGTERAFTGEYWNHHENGKYNCAACGAPLFDSGSKFDSGCGWPSYFKPTESSSITEHIDKSHGMIRTEVTCSKCGGHLGHVFTDGPAPTGLRYCINSASIQFVPEEGKVK